MVFMVVLLDSPLRNAKSVRGRNGRGVLPSVGVRLPGLTPILGQGRVPAGAAGAIGEDFFSCILFIPD